MRLAYDPHEDRVRLMMTHGEEDVSLWLTRRQCVNLLGACLRAGAQDDGSAADVTAERKTSASDQSASAQKPEPQVTTPVLSRMALGESDGVVVVRFALPEGRKLGFRLHAQQRKKLIEAFRNLERQARWDMFAAALDRSAAKSARGSRIH
jgi:hypothetical protein